jgi:hypothetical protein
VGVSDRRIPIDCYRSKETPMGTVHKLVMNRKDRREAAVSCVAKALRGAIEAMLGQDASFEQQERTALEIANEATRRVLEDSLQELADGHPEEVKVHGRRYRRHQPGTLTYHSLCGPLEVLRWTYRRCDIRNGPTIVPLELEAGMIERVTPALGYSMALGYARGPMRHYEEDMRAAHRVPPARATLERIAKAIGTAAKRSVVEVEPCVRAKERMPDEIHAICISLDRTSVPMEEPRSASTPTEEKRPRRRERVRKPPPPVEVHYRMAYVGAVSFVDQHAETVVKRMYAATAKEGPEEILTRMMADVRAALEHKKGLKLAVVQDASPEMWGWLWDTMELQLPGREYHCLIDWYHYAEHLAAALRLIEPDDDKRAKLFREWTHRLHHFYNATDRLEEWLDKQKAHRKSDCLRLLTEVGYLTGHGRERANYAKFKKMGLPVGSGVTEGACKSLLAMRVKRGGQRWREQGLRAVMALRSLHQSERLPSFWKLFKREYKAVVRAAA